MARGKLGILTGAAVLGLFAVFTTVSPAVAQPAVSDDAVGGVDNLSPSAPTSLEVQANPELLTVDLIIGPSEDDFIHQVPAGGDFTSGGTFVNTNDVAAYLIKRSDDGGELVVIGEVEALGASAESVATFTDDTTESGIGYAYCVSAVDAAGNESDDVCADEVSLGPPGDADVETPEDVEDLNAQVVLTFDTEIDVEDQAVVDDFVRRIKELLAQLLGINIDRLANIVVTQGSVVVTFDILPEADGGATELTPDQASDEIERIVAQEPEQLSSIGPVVGFQKLTAGRLRFGVVGVGNVVIKPFRVSNTSTNPEAVLVVNVGVNGNGFSTSSNRLSLAAGESGTFDISFNPAAVGNLNGAYTGTLAISTNDTKKKLTSIRLTASIEDGLDPGAISVSSAINFGPTTVGETKVRLLNISNLGDLDLDIALELTDNGNVFTLSSTSETVAGDGSVDVTVTYTPSRVTTNVGGTSDVGSIKITSNDAVNPEIIVALSGDGTNQRLLVDPVTGDVILGDFDGNAVVNFQDFFLFAENFGLNNTDINFDPLFDLDSNGTIDFQDFFIFAENFGKRGVYIGATDFTANLSGEQQTPPVVSAASGNGSFSLSADESELSFAISFSGLTSDFSGAHIHVGAAGESGSVVRAFDGTTEIVLDGAGGGTITGTWNEASLADNIDALKNAGLYVNIHSADNPSGEIRGQILAQ